jgi:hypothetical protein
MCNKRQASVHSCLAHIKKKKDSNNKETVKQNKSGDNNVLTVIYVINAHNLAENGLFRTCYGKM